MTVKRKSWKSAAYAAVALGAALTMVGALAASAPAYATSAGAPRAVRGFGIGMPGLRAGPLAPGVPSPTSQLFGVFCTSAANCWAVGNTDDDVELNLVLHWTGKHWFKVAVPNPAGTRSGDANELFAVRCTSASNCWAVGDAKKPKHADLDQALHWNGKKWLAVSTPTPGGVLSGDFNMLDDVTCLSSRNCWAVGDYGELIPTTMGNARLELNQVLHWNGEHWSLVRTPNPGGMSVNHGSALAAVRCASATECWAAGTFGMLDFAGKFSLHNEMLRWNGKKWVKVTVPSPGGTAMGAINELNGLACASVVNCWAAGVAGSLTSNASTNKLLNDVLHWNGKNWSIQAVPEPGGGGAGSANTLLGITCSSARNCWAVGSAGTLAVGPPTLNEVLRWNGTRWSSFKTPNPGGTGMGDLSTLNGVRCTSAANCWAVGESQQTGGIEHQEILHWTGRKWFVG